MFTEGLLTPSKCTAPRTRNDRQARFPGPALFLDDTGTHPKQCNGVPDQFPSPWRMALPNRDSSANRSTTHALDPIEQKDSFDPAAGVPIEAQILADGDPVLISLRVRKR